MLWRCRPVCNSRAFTIICCGNGRRCNAERKGPLIVGKTPVAGTEGNLQSKVVSRGLRKAIFWMHLAAGLIAGVVIAIMCFTGVALAFEKEMIAWADRDVRAVRLSDGGKALTVDEVFSKVTEAHPHIKPTALVI